MGSTRLPGKVLKDLGGSSVLSRVISRVRRSSQLDDLIVATTSEQADDQIVNECVRCSTTVFRGDQDDVLDRYYGAAQFSQADVIVRITSDCPLIDPEIADRTIRAFLDQRPDYASNALERTYPRGLDTEALSFSALEQTWRDARESYERAHVTPYIYQNPSIFRILAVVGTADFSFYRWTLDTLEDLEFVRAVYASFDGRDDFTWRDVIALMERKPNLAELNRHVVQKELREG